MQMQEHDIKVEDIFVVTAKCDVERQKSNLRMREARS